MSWTTPKNRGILLTLFSIAWGACFLAARAESGKPFSHELHKEQGAGCTDCHDADRNPPAPKKAACASCHEEGKTPAYVSRPREAPRTVFSHPRLRDSGRCDSCHTPERQGGMSLRPESHGPQWMKRHGGESEQSQDLPGRDCKTCHTQGACRACHLEKRPQSHAGLWRVRTHGSSAEWDHGDSCRTCHETGSCQGCHRATKPINHRGNWRTFHAVAAEGPGSESCLVCHRKIECAACHLKR